MCDIISPSHSKILISVSISPSPANPLSPSSNGAVLSKFDFISDTV